MGFLFFYFAMILTTTTFLWSLMDSKGTLDSEGKISGMVLGLIWPLTIIILLIMTNNDNDEDYDT